MLHPQTQQCLGVTQQQLENQRPELDQPAAASGEDTCTANLFVETKAKPKTNKTLDLIVGNLDFFQILSRVMQKKIYISCLQVSTIFTIKHLVYIVIDVSCVLDDECHIPAWLSASPGQCIFLQTLTLLVAFKAMHARKQVLFVICLQSIASNRFDFCCANFLTLFYPQ